MENKIARGCGPEISIATAHWMAAKLVRGYRWSIAGLQVLPVNQPRSLCVSGPKLVQEGGPLQQSPAFLAPGTSFAEDNFSTDGEGSGDGGGQEADLRW